MMPEAGWRPAFYMTALSTERTILEEEERKE